MKPRPGQPGGPSKPRNQPRALEKPQQPPRSGSQLLHFTSEEINLWQVHLRQHSLAPRLTVLHPPSTARRPHREASWLQQPPPGPTQAVQPIPRLQPDPSSRCPQHLVTCSHAHGESGHYGPGSMLPLPQGHSTQKLPPKGKGAGHRFSWPPICPLSGTVIIANPVNHRIKGKT